MLRTVKNKGAIEVNYKLILKNIVFCITQKKMAIKDFLFLKF